LSAAPAQAVPFKISYDFSYQPPTEAGPAYPDPSTLGGTLQFYTRPLPSGSDSAGICF
jgi:hypothetical protein